MKWKVDKEKTKAYWLELNSIDEFDYPKYHATVKWDGCIDLNEISLNGEADQYYHICDLDDLIERLQNLKKEAVKHFGTDWGK